MAWAPGLAGHLLMILVDTNVLSAITRVTVEPAVEQWFDAQPPESIWTTAKGACLPTEILGMAVGDNLNLQSVSAWRYQPPAARDRLDDAFGRAIDEVLGRPLLPFDRSTAKAAAAIAAGQRQIGRPVETRDVQIAGIAAARKATLAIRNTRHFGSSVRGWWGRGSAGPPQRTFSAITSRPRAQVSMY
jgi:toxin FitB